MEVITISGKARHGKDTCALMLKELLEEDGKSVIITHYADYLKYIAMEYYGWDGKKDAKGREILQKLGTDKARANNPNIWVNVLIELARAIGEDFDYMILGDCRFPNEINRWKINGYKTHTIKVERDVESNLTDEQKSHPSEIALDDFNFDAVIINNYSPQILKRGLKKVINDLLYEMEYE